GASGVHGIPEAAVRALVAGCDLLCIGTDNTDHQLDEIVEAIEAAVLEGRLPAERVREAAARVRALGATAPAAPEQAVLSAVIEPEHDGTDRARIAEAFAVSDAALERLADAPGIGTVVRVDTEVNIAIGVAPWGPFAVEPVEGHPSWLDAAALVPVAEGGLLTDPSELAGPVLVIGKDFHRHATARHAIDALRAVRDDVVTIDMGWPSNDGAFADVSTFGASRLVGEAVIDFVAARLRTASAAEAGAAIGAPGAP
ncbi:MAG TPA: hypothetical protein VFE99_05440, partial [Agromyces sp.]|nr:hypothetical protein [Agromyces sp.]